MTYLLALDQGTSSSRSIVFDEHGHIVALAQQELPQIYPRPGWVEHNLMEIWRTQLATAREVLAKHDEKYMPKEVADALKKSGEWNRGAPPQ